MAATKPRTSMYADGHTYSLFDPEEVHRDMRIDLARATVVLRRSRAVFDSHEFCNECRGIAAQAKAARQAAGEPSGGYASLDEAIIAHSERRTRYVISRANLARLIGLGRGERVARMYVSDDPQLLHVIVDGEHHQPVPDGAEVPVSRMSRLT